MVPGDDKHLKPQIRKRRQKPVEDLHRSRRGHGAVVDIPAEKHGVRLLLPGALHHLGKHGPLVLQHGEPVHDFSDMQIGGMDKFHARLLVTAVVSVS